MRHSFGAFVVLASLTGVIPAVSVAAPFTPHFDPLITELQLRRDSGELTVKQQNATVASLERFDAPSDSLATDLQTARAVTKKLAKAFPAEFDTSSGWGAFIDGVGSLMNDAVQELRGDVSQARQPLDEAFDAIPWDPHGCPVRVKYWQNKALTLTYKALVHENLAKQAQDLLRSLAVIPRGMKAAVKCAEKLGVPLPPQ